MIHIDEYTLLKLNTYICPHLILIQPKVFLEGEGRMTTFEEQYYLSIEYNIYYIILSTDFIM